MSDTPRPLIRLVIKEELLILTGDYVSALLLQQMIYWSERTRDVDKFLQEEKKRMNMNKEDLKVDLLQGWIYKSNKELSQELLEIVKEKTVERRMDALVDKGWLHRRNHPKYKWDRTYQYRVNIIKIQEELQELGYGLDNYPLFKGNVKKSKPNVTETDAEDILTGQGDNLSNQDDNESNQIDNVAAQQVSAARQSGQEVGAIPEITPETTTIDYDLEIITDTPTAHDYYEQLKKMFFKTNVNNKLVPKIVEELKRRGAAGFHSGMVNAAAKSIPEEIEKRKEAGFKITDPAAFVADILVETRIKFQHQFEQEDIREHGQGAPVLYNWLEE